MTNNPIDKKDLLDVIDKEIDSLWKDYYAIPNPYKQTLTIQWLSGNINALEKLKEKLQLTTTQDDQ